MPQTNERIVLAHGGGGELTRRLIADRFLPKLGNPLLNPLTDSAVIERLGERVAFTTDAHVIQPLEFPGGNIGGLAVCGTVNDLVVAGAVPVALSLAVVLEEGLSLEVLDRIIDSIAAAAKQANVLVVTGDTKVVEHQRGDGLTITTTGLGRLRDGVRLDPARIHPGDVLIITGRIAEHGLAVMSAREGLAFQTELRSDLAPLTQLADRIFQSGADVKFMRDPTRGGLAGVAVDLVEETSLSLELDEASIPISGIARHTSELLGLDPLTVPNEGKALVVVAPSDAAAVLAACRSDPLGAHAAVVGRFTETQPALVELVTRSGGRRLVQRPYGEELPRIC